MKITEHQLIHLLAVLKDSCRIVNSNQGGLTRDDREALYNQIVGNQNEVIETKKELNKDE